MTENADTSNDVVERRHDPLCRFHRESGEFDFVADDCARCEFIAKVRADEREKAAKRIWTLRPDRVYTSGGIAYTDALKDAIEAVYGRADIVGGES